jgi:hypothetical protein
MKAVFLAVREWHWDRDRNRRITAMLARERANLTSAGEQAEALAKQLDEIRALPEVFGQRP